MAFTLGALTEIDDTAVDAESPITESLMTSLRDNAYWIVAGTTQTTETTAGKLLETTGGAGDMQWTAKTTIAVDKTKGGGVTGTTSGSPTQIAEVSDKAILIFIDGKYTTSADDIVSYKIIIDQTDYTYRINAIEVDIATGLNYVSSFSGTLTGSFVDVVAAATGPMFMRVTGGNVELYTNVACAYSYIWL